MPKNHKWPNDVTISLLLVGFAVASVQMKDVKQNEENQDEKKKIKIENESTFNS